MEYDTVADTTIIGFQTWKLMGSPELRSTNNVCGYGNFPVKTLGEFDASIPVSYTHLTLPTIYSV